MQSRPFDLSDAVLAMAVTEGWKLESITAVYRPVGFGSHHWAIDDGAGGRWFASVDVLAEGDPDESFVRLATALDLAATARDGGLTFVVAPVRSPDGAVVRRLLGRYALALYPCVAGRSGSFNDAVTPEDATELTGLLCSLHAVPHAWNANAGVGRGVETFAVPGRILLESALRELADADFWPGPYGERLRPLLANYADDTDRVLGEHDRLVTAAGPQTDRLVLTHGEPHPGNLIHTPSGLMLVDWDTALLGPPERDVWMLDARTGGEAADDYTARSGRPLNPELLARYNLAWSLADLAEFVELLRFTPDKTADTEWSWDALLSTLDDLSKLPDRPH